LCVAFGRIPSMMCVILVTLLLFAFRGACFCVVYISGGFKRVGGCERPWERAGGRRCRSAFVERRATLGAWSVYGRSEGFGAFLTPL
jgi:hypothetical protein